MESERHKQPGRAALHPNRGRLAKLAAATVDGPLPVSINNLFCKIANVP